MHSSLGSCPEGLASDRSDISHLSYKFQRLREQLRNAILSGELSGRLPGERELGRRYEANAKTINKALCDLSSEGLVVRRIGRGTFVTGPTANGGLTATKIYSCLMPDASGASPHRAVLLERLRSSLAATGHKLVAVDRAERGRSAVKVIIGAGSESGVNGQHTAADRQAVHGLFCCPADPLGASQGAPSDDLVNEVLRRQLPFVLIGMSSAAAKVCAVVPDLVDGGFRLAEHLLAMGCARVWLLTASAGSRCHALVLSGAQTAAARAGKGAVQSDSCLPVTLTRIAAASASEKVGVIAVGSALGLVMRDAAIAAARRDRRITIAALCEPSDAQASAANVTSYEVDASRMASWAARLATEYRAGQRPVEIVVPGMLCVREGGANGQRTGATLGDAVV